MSPFGINPCPNLIEIGGFWFCEDYENRPQECRNHSFDARFCPIGLDVLKLKSLDEIRYRIDKGWELSKQLNK